MKLLFRLAFTFFIVLNSYASFSQNEEEQLRKKIELNKDSLLIKSYLDLGKYYYFISGKGDSLIVYGTKALSLSKSLNYQNLRLEAIKYIGTGYLSEEDYNSAEKFFLNGLELAEHLKKIKVISDFHFRLGAVFQNKGENRNAIEHMIKSANYAQQSKDYKNEANSYYGISGIYAEEKQAKKQLEYIEKALKIIEFNDIDDSYLETIIYAYAAETYLTFYTENSNQEYEVKLLNFSKKALNIANANNFESRKVIIYSLLGKYYNYKKNYTKSEFYAKQIINSKVKITDASLINAYTLLIKVYTVQNKKRMALRYVDSLNSSNLKFKSSFGEAISNSSYVTYKHFGEIALALKSLEEYVEFNKEFYNVSKTKALNELEIKYQSQLKDAEITTLNQQQKINELELETKQNKIKRLTLSLIIAASLAVFILFINKLFQLKKTRQKNQELKLALDRQIQLEKELSDVRDEIAQDFHDDLGNKLARISLLSNLVSGTQSINDPKVKLKLKQITEDANGLYKGTRDFVFSLKSNSDYLEEVATYLSDFGEDFFSKTKTKFVVEKHISENIKLPHYWNKQLVFIFKEALTNVLKHSNCDNVTLSFIFKNNKLTINCIDDGIGMSNENIISSNGLTNIKNRAVKIGGLLKINSEKEKGTTITFAGNTTQK